MRLAILLLTTGVLQAAVQRDGNRIAIPDSDDGGVVIEFGSGVAFQYERWFGAKPPVRGAPLSFESHSIAVAERDDATVLTTKFLEVTVSKSAVNVKLTSGRELTSMPKSASKTAFQLKTFPDEMFYGLGATDVPTLNLKGLVIPSTRPLLLSSRGYGIYAKPGAVFDLGKSDPDQISVTTNQPSFQFYYGPNIKEILEQYVLATHSQVDLTEDALNTRDEKALPKELHRLDINEKNYCDSPRILNQLALSGDLFPALDLGKLGRFDQYVRLMPFLFDTKTHPELEQRRSPWQLYLIAYLREAHDRGLPFVRPLLMQFPQDKGLETRSEVFMLGDEILLAPGCNVTEVELPRGTWTDLRTNARHPGRRKIANDPKGGLPIYAKAGSLIPLANQNRLELHYFPNSGAEFFVFESDVNEYSQFHAAPAGDFTRVESESKVARTCEWVLHHTGKPVQVGETGKPFQEATSRAALKSGTWFHDSVTGNLHIVVATAAGEDHIVNMTF